MITLDFAHSVYTIKYNPETNKYRVYRSGEDVTQFVDNMLVKDLILEIIDMRKAMQIDE